MSEPTAAGAPAGNDRVAALAELVEATLGGRVRRLPSLASEIAYEVSAEHLLDVARQLRDAPELKFETCVDVCGVDYLDYGRSEWNTQRATGTGFSRGVARGAPRAEGPQPGRRFAVVYHLLSVSLNRRLRLKAYCAEDEFPVLDSVTGVWASADWFERETFDLFGILFRGHPDLRRLLTDYGFVGHPFRKDFPLSGNVEVRYDPEKARVVYEPVSIEPRIGVPKVIRHDNRYDPALTNAPINVQPKPNA